MPIINLKGMTTEWWRMAGLCFSSRRQYSPSDFGHSCEHDALWINYDMQSNPGDGMGCGFKDWGGNGPELYIGEIVESCKCQS